MPCGFRASEGSSAGFTPGAGVVAGPRLQRAIREIGPAEEDAMTATEDFTKPAGMAIPKEGYIERVDGPYGPLFPKTPANYGFSILAKVKPGREETVRAYGKSIEDGIKGNPGLLAPLKLH